MYKLYARPHLDYGDVMYHKYNNKYALKYDNKYDSEMKLDTTKRLERTQYSAALAVTGAWRGTSRQRLFEELGWESLYQRRWHRRMCHFFNLKKKTRRPAYLFDEIPAERNVSYNLRRQRECQPTGTTARFASTYFQNVLFEWNLLDQNIKDSNTLAEFKRQLLAVIRPVKQSVYNVYNMTGIRNLTKLRVKFSPLNEHRFRHNCDC